MGLLAIKIEEKDSFTADERERGLGLELPSEVNSEKIFGVPSDVVYKQLYALRMTQKMQNVDLSSLTRTQWGLSSLKFTHHIVLSPLPKVIRVMVIHC